MNRSAIFVWAIIAACFIAVPSFAQTLTTSDLPGSDRVSEIQEVISSITRSPQAGRFKWSEDGSMLYFTLDSKRKQLELSNGTIGEATEEQAAPTEPSNGNQRRLPPVARARQRTSIDSPDGKWRAVYRDFNVVVEPIGDEELGPNEARREAFNATTSGTEKKRYGTCCWVYGEELSQQDAMWWSPDSRKLAFYEISESHMKTYYLTTGNTSPYTGLHKEQYPIAGEDNPHVALLVYDLDSQTTTRIKVDAPIDQYLYDIGFTPNGEEILIHSTNRWQNELDLLAADPNSGSTRKVVSETQETWQENSPMMRFLDDGQRFIWETERTGWRQFELRHLHGHKINELTPEAQYPCGSILSVNEENGWIYYTAYSGDNPLNVHLHRVKLDGTNDSKLTNDQFTYSQFNMSPDNQWFVARYENINTPPAIGVFDMEGNQLTELSRADDSAAKEAGLAGGELFTFTADDGETTVYGTLFKPANYDPEKAYPLIIDVYGGPGSSGVSNRYQPGRAQCEYGFMIAKIGNRGTVNRGKAFESANYMKLGEVDILDQADGVKFLAERPYIDGDRVGIYGHSYGGYMSALALLKFPEIFHVGVAGAPVTDWRNYDTIYTERYMRTPQVNEEGYDEGSCLKYVENLKGKLFLLHGLVDDNVHPSNTWQLAKALQDANKRFDMMVYPNSAHGFRYRALLWDYMIQHLNPDDAND